ncbi:MAG TPA: protein kinase, partial [Polyangiaceae bacterium]|nr:protein kinase [Polyangiaceae bacterium]
MNLDIDLMNGTVTLRCVNLDAPRIASARLIISAHLPEIAASLPPTSQPRSVASQNNLFSSGAKIDCYSLRKRVGAGFSSEVWEAEVEGPAPVSSLEPGQRVALKCYSPQFLRERIESIRIQREFQLASEIQHPNIVKVHDLVMSPSRGYTFIAMDLV